MNIPFLNVLSITLNGPGSWKTTIANCLVEVDIINSDYLLEFFMTTYLLWFNGNLIVTKFFKQAHYGDAHIISCVSHLLDCGIMVR